MNCGDKNQNEPFWVLLHQPLQQAMSSSSLLQCILLNDSHHLHRLMKQNSYRRSISILGSALRQRWLLRIKNFYTLRLKNDRKWVVHRLALPLVVLDFMFLSDLEKNEFAGLCIVRITFLFAHRRTQSRVRMDCNCFVA